MGSGLGMPEFGQQPSEQRGYQGGDDRERREHCERLRDKEYDIRESLAYTPPYSEERGRLEYRLREVHDERARCWAKSFATAGPDETILASASEDGIARLGRCGSPRTRMLPSPGEFFCVYAAPEAQQQGPGTAPMIAMARFLADRSVWNNLALVLEKLPG